MKKIVALMSLLLTLVTLDSYTQNVGINSDGSNPESSTMLDIKSVGTTTATFGLKVKDSAGDSKLVVRSDGSVGVGIDTPQNLLDIDGRTIIRGANNAPRGTLGHLTLTGGESDYTIAVQDATARINHYWNASPGVSNTFLVGAENASKLSTSATGGNAPLFAASWADGSLASAGDPITWSEYFRITSEGNVGIWTDQIPHGGIGVAKFALEGTDASGSGPHVQFTTSADDYPIMQQLNWSHDNITLNFDSYYDGAWKSSDVGSNFQISKFGDILKFGYDNGIAQGSVLSWNPGIVLTTSGNVGIGTADPDAALDVNGFMVLNNNVLSAPRDNGGYLRMVTGTSEYVLTTQDGTGRVLNYWNSTVGNPNNYIVTGEAAGKITFHPAGSGGTTMGLGNWYGLQRAINGTAGNAITWDTQMVIDTMGTMGLNTEDPWSHNDAGGLHINGTFFLTTDETNSAKKDFALYGNSYDTSEENNLWVWGISDATKNLLRLGSSHSSYNAPNEIEFWTTTDRTTPASAAQAMKILQDGKVGIGTSNPAQTLDVDGSIGIGASSNAFLSQFGATLTYQADHTTTARMTFKDVDGITAGSINGTDAGNFGLLDANSSWTVLAVTNNSLRFSVSNTEYMRILSTGNVGIGTTAPAQLLDVNGNIAVSGVTVHTSDKRYKKNINTIENALANISQLRGVKYQWKAEEFPDKNFENRKQIGVIAQEVEKIYPELVFTDEDGYKSVNYSHLTPVLIEAIKELKTENEAQKHKIAKLESSVLDMNAKDDKLEIRLKELEDLLKTTRK